MPDEIAPALSAEQWGHWHGEGGYVHPHPTRASTGYLGDYADEHYGYANGHHALAALALHEQPFGFTHADVANIGEAKHFASRDGAPEELIDWLDTLAARIAALLPPE